MMMAFASPSSMSMRLLQQHIFFLLEKCNSMRELQEIHAQIITNGFSHKKFLLAKLVSFCSTSSSGNLAYAYRAFNMIHQPTLPIWNHIIRGFALIGNIGMSLSLFDRMRELEAQPDSFTYSFLLKACAFSMEAGLGQEIHARVIHNGLASSSVFVQTNLINMYATGGELEDARHIFDGMLERNVVSWNAMLAAYARSGGLDEAWRLFDEMPERNVVSWTTMIAGCSQTGHSRQALALFRQMQHAHIEADQVVMVSVLSACAELGALDLGKWIDAYISGKGKSGWGSQRLVSLDNALIHMYAKCGVIERARLVFEEMQARTPVSWTAMINGYAIHGLVGEAVTIFQGMEKHGFKPDHITFIGILYACAHAGWVDMGRKYFKCMSPLYSIEPRVEHYGCMVDLLGRAGHLDEAYRLIESMPMEPNDVVWGALLTRCRIHKDLELAMRVVGHLLELDPGNAGYMVLLSNIYALGQRWGDATRVREEMKERGIKKPAGCSWIEVKGVVHEFTMGDRSHKHADAIYEMVEEMRRRAKFVGYVPDSSEMLLDVLDGEEREELLWLHSEKLAVAFGLLRVPRGMAIRIVKNLRICRDCHTMAKIISKTFDREMSIRDRNRFHHFKTGFCSCNDYW
ncbi:hypothetical protein AMTRI_Chr04g190710 [Amborella trichopoda]